MAVTTNFGVPVSGSSAILMPKLQYRFRVTFGKLGKAGANTTVVTQNVINVGRPSLTHEEVIVDSYNSKMYLAGKHTWEPITIVLRDDMTSAVILALGNQLNKQLDHTSQESASSGEVYKFDMTIETLDGASGGAEKTIDKWDLNGCYLSNVQYGDLNYGTSEMVQVTATIRYDNASNEITGGVTDTLSGDPQTPAP
jgi:hypothetical protein|tara:strand:- start:994 stop:1584 length:591 start_codon:yes stop_codon:yes gene_type:complete